MCVRFASVSSLSRVVMGSVVMSSLSRVVMSSLSHIRMVMGSGSSLSNGGDRVAAWAVLASEWSAALAAEW